MLNSSSLSWTAPVINTNTKTKARKTVSSTILVKPSARVTARTKFSILSALPVKKVAALAVPTLAVVFSAAIVSFFALHLYWTNTYSAKGFALKSVQTAISEQTDTQKKLLKQQSALNSSITLADMNDTSMVPITNEEYLTSKQLTTR